MPWPPATLEALPLHLYNTVIQQLKQQKHELQLQNLTEQRRARTTENFSQTVLSNLPSGVLVFGHNGLVKQANPAAKEILGFRSLSGMSPQDVFRKCGGFFGRFQLRRGQWFGGLASHACRGSACCPA